MANVLFVGCPAEYRDVLPAGAAALAPDSVVAPKGVFQPPPSGTRPDLVVIGPSAEQPSVLAQRAAQTYPGVDVLIAVRKRELARLGELLKITPYIPVRTVLVSSQPKARVAKAIQRAAARCDARNGHRRVMLSVQRSLAVSASVLPQVHGDSTPAEGIPVPATELEGRVLAQFFRFYASIRGELPSLLARDARSSPVSSWLLGRLEDASAVNPESVLDLGSRALAEGDWGPYTERIRAIAQAHADSGRSFVEWLEASEWVRQELIDKLLTRHGRDAEPLRDVLHGMEVFLRVTLSAVERVRSTAHAALVGRHQSDAQLFAAAVESSEDAILTTSLDGTLTAQNPAAERLFGYAADAIGENFAQLAPESKRPVLREIIAAAAAGDGTRGFETKLRHRQGRLVEVQLTLSPVIAATRVPVGISIIARDVSEAKMRERALRQAQKMEAMGRLAGGVAHDFNNLLTVILAHASFMLEDAGDPGAIAEYSSTITETAERGRALTQQLLAFARRQPIQAQVLDASQALEKSEKLFRRTIPSSIKLQVRWAAGLWSILIDPGHFDQLSMNLVLNAVDAMPDGGDLTVEVRNHVVLEATAVLPAGDYVLLTVSDTGVGISEADLGHVFEPFFTTKGEGKGSGLGLATCYAIAREASGDIRVSSQHGKGSRFEVLLPRCHAAERRERDSDRPAPVELTGRETVLVVEDEPTVLETITRMLQRYGYTVLTAPDGMAALDVMATTQVELVLTDTVMPQMGGPELAERLATSHPSVPVVFMTGYADEKSLRNKMLPPASEIMLKPFATEDLMRKVREVLDKAALGS